MAVDLEVGGIPHAPVPARVLDALVLVQGVGVNPLKLVNCRGLSKLF